LPAPASEPEVADARWSDNGVPDRDARGGAVDRRACLGRADQRIPPSSFGIAVNSAGQCLYPGTGFINTTVTGTSFATGKQGAPAVFDIDIYQDGKCYTPNNYGVLNREAVNALHAQGDKVIGYIDAGAAETWRPDYPQYSSFNTSCGGGLFGKPVSGFRDEFWLNINTYRPLAGEISVRC
jgi:Glycoside-hydrolase family GH114